MTKSYTQLLQDLQDYCENTDPTFVAQIPHIVEMCELDLARRLRHLDFFRETDTTKTLAAGTATLTKPTDNVITEGIWARIGTKRYPIYRKSQSFCNLFWPDRARSMAWPRNAYMGGYYCDVDLTTWLFVPTPLDAVPLDIAHAILPVSVVSSGSNWFTENAYDLLLACCMTKAERWDKSFDASKVWSDEYERLGSDVGGEGWQQNRDNASSQGSEGG